MSCILIGGGSRSGKSRFALERANACRRPLAFIATAELRDDEMTARATAHRVERGDGYHTIEEPREVARAIIEAGERYGAIVVDCLTLWLSNLMFSEPTANIAAKGTALLRAAVESPAAVFLVTNEVGSGIVPADPLSRKFRDEAGFLNQQAAAAANEVHWMVFGIPLRVK